MERYVIHVTKECNCDCLYCLTEDTEITMGDFSKRKISDIKEGDIILGFDEYPNKNIKHRRIKPAKVLKLYKRESEVVRLVFEDNSFLDITKNHLILTNRGKARTSWKEAGSYKINQKVMSFPTLTIKPLQMNKDYKTGYFISMMLGDGTNKKYIDKNGYNMFKTRLAVKDIEIIDRIKAYCEDLDINLYESDYKVSTFEGDVFSPALFGNTEVIYNQVNKLIDANFRQNKTFEYYMGFLAGIYDAEGSIDKSSNTIRITNSDKKILDEIKEGLELLDIKYVIEIPKHKVNKQCYVVRLITGKGLRGLNNLKFILQTKPCVKRKGYENFYNIPIRFTKRIKDIKPLGIQKVYNIGTESKTYIANNIAVHNCYEQDKTSTYTWEEVKELIDKILQYRTSDEFGIEFLGGEPMLRWDLIRKSYEYLEGIKEVDIIDYVITTNGTIMNEEIADYLSKNEKMRFAVSMDGHKWSNQLRVFKDSRKNTYDKVMENINFLKKYGVESSIHITSHPYNIGFLSESIDHLYKQGIKNIDVGTVESTIKIDKEYCDRFIKELDLVSQKIVDGTYPDLHIGLFEWLKPYEDVRSYIKDPVTGKTIAESYGRSGNDITHTDDYEVVRCDYKDDVSEMIYHIRKTVYDNHQRRLKEVRNNDN